MGILRTREEYLPVTCAILKPEDRELFFDEIKKVKGSRPEAMAKLCHATVDQVNDWIAGRANIPYPALQTLGHHYNVGLPQVTELRREYQAIAQIKGERHGPRPEDAPKPSRATKALAAGEARRERKPRGEKRGGRGGERQGGERQPRGERQARQPKARQPQQQRQGQQPRQRQQQPQRQRGEPRQQKQRQPQQQRQGQQPRQRQQQQPRQKGQPRQQAPKGPTVPKPTESLAYWAGILLAGARREADAAVFRADRRIGQNFAAIWANLTKQLCGVKPALSMLDDGKVQQASMPAAGFEEFFDKLDFKLEKSAEGAGIPRWCWSNPAWKTAALKGVVDASAHFHRTPSLTLVGLQPRLSRSVVKILDAMDLKSEAGPVGELVLKGKEAVEKYFDAVGTGNLKLRDQINAYRRQRHGEHPSEPEKAPLEVTQPGLPEGAAAPEDDEAAAAASRFDMDTGSETDAEAFAEAASAAESQTESGEAGPEVPAGGTPKDEAASKKTVRRRRTLFRGRPDA